MLINIFFKYVDINVELDYNDLTGKLGNGIAP